MTERPLKNRKPVLRSEALLDAAVEYTFPASDPISIEHAFGAAREREDRALQRSPSGGAPGSVSTTAPRRTPPAEE